MFIPSKTFSNESKSHQFLFDLDDKMCTLTWIFWYNLSVNCFILKLFVVCLACDKHVNVYFTIIRYALTWNLNKGSIYIQTVTIDSHWILMVPFPINFFCDSKLIMSIIKRARYGCINKTIMILLFRTFL